MGADTHIEWADHTFNPWLGCAKVSAACTNCYAESWAKRYDRPELWRGTRKRTSVSNWRAPIRWNRETPGARVFCASLADVFEDLPELGPWRVDLFELIAQTPALNWLLLTKRPEVAAHWFRHHAPPDNVWMGTTVENQAEADRRIPALLEIPARVRFLSMEPLLGPVDLSAIPRTYDDETMLYDPLIGRWHPKEGFDPGWASERIQWIIAGGESGPRARPSHPAWFRSLRDQCEGALVPFHFKQWGEFLPSSEIEQRADPELDAFSILGHATVVEPKPGAGAQVLETVFRVGKARAGRLLDGRTWDGLPGGAR